MEEGISLSELAEIIALGLKKTLEPRYWIVGEISEVQANRNGHCYLELIEKPEDEQNPTAKMRAVIWANTYRMLAPYFESETGCQLSVGMKILVQVSVTFHALYGFSLQIHDINPVYTIGEDEQRRLKIIRQLEEDGIFELNKELMLPTVIQRIAIISSPTAAGYQDFMQQLKFNQYDIKFQTTLFPAAMQGVEVEHSVVEQLDNISKYEDEFDAVVIIRGGGARTDLRWFDSYEIASNVAQFPLPVITGIGHDKDQSITDLVANTSLKTPTAVAEFVISTTADFISQLETYQEQILNIFNDEIESQVAILKDFGQSISQSMQVAVLQTNNKLASIKNAIQHWVEISVRGKQNKIDLVLQKIKDSAIKRLLQESNLLQIRETSVLAKDPKTVLQQGYSITTTKDGEIIRHKKQVKKNDSITTHFGDGTITSTVN